MHQQPCWWRRGARVLERLFTLAPPLPILPDASPALRSLAPSPIRRLSSRRTRFLSSLPSLPHSLPPFPPRTREDTTLPCHPFFAAAVFAAGAGPLSLPAAPPDAALQPTAGRARTGQAGSRGGMQVLGWTACRRSLGSFLARKMWLRPPGERVNAGEGAAGQTSRRHRRRRPVHMLALVIYAHVVPVHTISACRCGPTPFHAALRPACATAGRSSERQCCRKGRGVGRPDATTAPGGGGGGVLLQLCRTPPCSAASRCPGLLQPFSGDPRAREVPAGRTCGRLTWQMQSSAPASLAGARHRSGAAPTPHAGAAVRAVPAVVQAAACCMCLPAALNRQYRMEGDKQQAARNTAPPPQQARTLSGHLPCGWLAQPCTKVEAA